MSSAGDESGSNGDGGRRVALAVSVQTGAGRGRYPRIDKDKWTRMLEAWRAKQTIVHVMRTVPEVGERLVKRAVYRGWPEIGLPPFAEIGKDRQQIYEEMAAHTARLDLSEAAQDEGTKQAAEEALACREVLRNSVRAGGILANLLEQVDRGVSTGHILLEGLSKNSDGVLVGTLDAKMLTALTRSASSLASAVEKAMEAERSRTGKPEEAVGVQVGLILDQLDPAELEAVGESGKLPARIIRIGGASPDALGFQDDMRPEGFEEEDSAEDPSATAGYTK